MPINNSNVTIYQLFYYFEILKYELQGLLDPFMYEDLLFNFLLQNAAHILCVFSVLYKIASTGIPRVLAFNYAADLREWLIYFVASMPLSAENNFCELSIISLLMRLYIVQEQF